MASNLRGGIWNALTRASLDHPPMANRCFERHIAMIRSVYDGLEYCGADLGLVAEVRARDRAADHGVHAGNTAGQDLSADQQRRSDEGDHKAVFERGRAGLVRREPSSRLNPPFDPRVDPHIGPQFGSYS